MLTGKEEKELIEGLQLETYPDHEAEFIRSLYISRLTKVAFLIQFNDLSTLSGVHARLGSVYKLAKNPAILLAQAEILMIQCDFIAAFKIISSYVLPKSDYMRRIRTIWTV